MEAGSLRHVHILNDLEAMEEALRGRDVAAVIMETIPATYGFPLPEPGYLRAVKALCEQYGLTYCARPLVPQVYSAWHRVVRLSLPNGWLSETNRHNVVPQLRKLFARPA